MKYLNYSLIVFALILASFYTFNHISAFLGIGIAFVTVYAVIWKITVKVKEVLKHIKF